MFGGRVTLEDHDRFLLIFIHGFKGDDTTFADFPNRIGHVLTQALHGIDAEAIVYPQYDTKGDLREAVELFRGWLERVVWEREEDIKRHGGRGKVWICLLGHSMGGIVAADTIIRYYLADAGKSPRIIGLLAYDTPYYGLHDQVFTRAAFDRASEITNKVSNAISLVSSAASLMSTAVVSTSSSAEADTPSANSSGRKSRFGKWGALALGAGVLAAGAALVSNKDAVGKGAEWMKSHLEFVQVLWNEEEMKQRVEILVKVPGITFHCYYTQIPGDGIPPPRTFIKLPPPDTATYFSAAASSAQDEIDAHVQMFDAVKNHHYYNLGNVTVKYLEEMINARERFPTQG